MTKAKFLISCENIRQCPSWSLPEIILLGRSNVGKSTFINTLANQKGLAKTSNTPGKTRLINFFNFDDKFILVDLPGYGYAKVSQTEQAKWNQNLAEFLLKREGIKAYLQFADARHDIQKNDLQMREWINANNLPVITILTKTDYLSKNQLNSRLAEVKKVFGDDVLPFAKGNSLYSKEVIKLLLSDRYEVQK